MTTAALRDTRRITEHDADFQRIRRRLEHDLMASVKRYVRELRSGDESSAVSAFIHRQTHLMWAGYLAAWKEGAQDYWQTVSNEPMPGDISPDPAKVKKALHFYLPSIAKMAGELQVAARQSVRLMEEIESYKFYNPNHYPAGSGRGGQFAPRGTGSGGDEGVVRVERGQGRTIRQGGRRVRNENHPANQGRSETQSRGRSSARAQRIADQAMGLERAMNYAAANHARNESDEKRAARVARIRERMQQSHEEIRQLERQVEETRARVDALRHEANGVDLRAAMEREQGRALRDEVPETPQGRALRDEALRTEGEIYNNLGPRLTTLRRQVENEFGLIEAERSGAVSDFHASERDMMAARSVFRNENISARDLEQMTGARPGDTVMLSSSDGNSITLTMRGRNGSNMDITLVRTHGRILASVGHATSGAPEERTAESGRRIVDAMEQMRRMGVDKLTTSAAGEGHRGMTSSYNGYRTWASLGFKGRIENPEIRRAASREFGENIARVEQLQTSRARRSWWNDHGEGFSATFDFRDPYCLGRLAALHRAAHHGDTESQGGEES